MARETSSRMTEPDPDSTDAADWRKPAAGRAKWPAGLYILATPIGNAGDITLRGLELLRLADVIACEDTRVTAKLLAIHGVPAAGRLTAYHDHNGDRARPMLLARIAAGEIVALVSDAGTPLISDPGYKLARAVIEAGHSVFSLPGASALLAALAVAGLPTDRFLFAGFLDPKSAARRSDLRDLATIRASLVFYESGPRLAASLADMAAVLGARAAVVARELTKRFETVLRGSLSELAARFAEGEEARGEIVIVVAPPEAGAETEVIDIDALLAKALENAPLKSAVADVTAATGLPRKTVYAAALRLRGDG
jgi:16S rRNA (cytidine1402-2'-O)-methyltransferase